MNHEISRLTTPSGTLTIRHTDVYPQAELWTVKHEISRLTTPSGTLTIRHTDVYPQAQLMAFYSQLEIATKMAIPQCAFGRIGCIFLYKYMDTL